MPESVIRGRSKGFTVIYNSALQDPRLSLKTIGLFAVMQSFPDNWEYSVSGLAARVRVGRDAVRSCLKELEDAGYLVREQQHGPGGKFAGTVYTLLDEVPAEKQPLTENPSTVETAGKSPLTEKPTTVKPSPVQPSSENRPQVNKHLSKETLSNNPIAPKGAQASDELFEKFWAAYPKKQNRAAALRAWAKLCPDSELCRVMVDALLWQRNTDQWRQDNGRFIPSPASWLRGRRWEDEPSKRVDSTGWIKEILEKRKSAPAG